MSQIKEDIVWSHNETFHNTSTVTILRKAGLPVIKTNQPGPRHPIRTTPLKAGSPLQRVSHKPKATYDAGEAVSLIENDSTKISCSTRPSTPATGLATGKILLKIDKISLF